MSWADALIAAVTLLSAGIGYFAATRTTSRQLAVQTRLAEKQQKRETLQRFNANLLQWADITYQYVASKGQNQEAWEREAYYDAWRQLTDSYSLLLLTSSDALMARIAEVYVPARDRLIKALAGRGLEGTAEAQEAAGMVRNAAGELLNDLREEIGEPRLAVIQEAADVTRAANESSDD